MTIRNNTRDGIKQAITDSEVKLLGQQLKKLQNPDLLTQINTQIVIRPNVAEAIQKFKDDAGKDIGERLKKLPPLKTDIHVDAHLILDKYGESAADFAERMKDIQKSIGDLILNFGDAIIEDIGKVAAGAKSPFSNLLDILGQGLEDVGKQLVAASTIGKAIRSAVANIVIAPELAAVAGIAAIALGGYLEGLSTKKVKAFADGGIVTGPTYGLVGEAGPEAIFPLAKLDRFIKNTQGNGGIMRVQVVGQLKGSDMLIMNSRAQKMKSLV